MIRPALLFGTALVALCACGNVSVHVAALRPLHGPSSHPVEIDDVGHAPVRAYEEVALLQAVGSSGGDVRCDVARALVARATAIGCDAVVGLQIDKGRSKAHGFGRCVRWLR